MQDARYKIQDARYKIQDADPACALGSVSGPRPWRDEGRGRCDLPASFVQAEGRTPNPVPGT
jgi:hypothetical protein